MKKNSTVLMLTILMALTVLILSIVLIILIDMKGSSTLANEETQQPAYEEVYIFKLEKSVVSNIKDSKKYVRCNFAIELGLLEEYNYLQKNEVKLTDLILTIISTKDANQFEKTNIQTVIKDEIRKKVETQLDIESIIKVYMTEFVIQ